MMKALHPIPQARPPQPPPRTRALERAWATWRAKIAAGEQTEQQSIARGLALLAVIAVVMCVMRWGVARAFVPGWWRQW